MHFVVSKELGAHRRRMASRHTEQTSREVAFSLAARSQQIAHVGLTNKFTRAARRAGSVVFL